MREITRFDDTHTQLWNTVRDQYPCAVVRDASYLNWKYVEQPGQDFVRLEILRDGRAVAVAVLTIRKSLEGRTCRRGVLIDVVLPPDDADVTWATLEAVRQTLQARGADLIDVDLTSAQLSPCLRSFGFFERPPLRVFLVSTEGLPPHEEALVTSPARWLLTGGDSDIDRPW